MKIIIALDCNKNFDLHLIPIDNEENKFFENKEFIERLKLKEKCKDQSYILFNKKDITLKMIMSKDKIEMPKHEFYSKVDVMINESNKPEDIIKMIDQIPEQSLLRLEADNIDNIIELMKSEDFISEMKNKITKFLYKGIEIEIKKSRIKLTKKILKTKY